MPTIGELLAQIRNGGMNPEPSGDSPYGGVQPGTNSPISQPGIDDLKEETKIAIGDYLSQRTKGFEQLEEQNRYPLEPDQTSTRLIDPNTGRPAPLTTISAPQQSFVNAEPQNAEELSLRDGFEILKRLGFFTDLEGDDGPEYDKNAQTDGHTLLNKAEVRTKISGVLATNRFSALTSPDAPFATPTEDTDGYEFVDENGVPKDHPQIEKIKEIAAFVLNNNKRAREAYPDAKFTLARDPDATGISALGESANLDYGDLNQEIGIDPASASPDSTAESESSAGVSNTPDFPFGIDSNPLHVSIVKTKLDLIVEAVDPAIQLLNGLFGLFGYNGVYTNIPGNPDSLTAGMRFGFGGFPLPTETDFGTGESTPPTFPAANAGYRFIQTLNVPLPRHLIMASGSPDDLVKKMVTVGVQYIKDLLDSDPTSMNLWKSFVRKSMRLFSLENNFGLPVIPTVPNMFLLTTDQKFLGELRDSPAMQFIRSMAVISETAAASSVSSGTDPSRGYRFGSRDLNSLVNSAVNRHASYAKKGYSRKAGLRNIPSMMLLPASFASGIALYRGNGVGVSIGLDPNTETNVNYLSLLQDHAIPTVTGENGPVPAVEPHGAMASKIGTPAQVDSHRFSRAEVEAIENILEAEHVPFYFHDLRTNEIVSFHAFLNALSDSFSPSYNASSGFGRIEDVQIYQKTQRAIQVDFTMVAMSKEDMQEMYFKMNKLVSMVYPQFSRGTMLEHKNSAGNTTRFVQPFSQVTTATPVIRLRVGDLVKSNYSREAIARLMGVNDPDFEILSPADPASTTAPLPCQTIVQNIIQLVTPKPLRTDGTYDPSIGWPVGSTVIVDPNYGRGADDPLVAFDPETNSVGSDWSADIIPGKIGVKILSYHTFNNPLGGSNPNLEEIVIKCELVPSLPIDFFPTKDRIATRTSTGEKILVGYLSYNDIQIAESAELYCHGINIDLFDDQGTLDTVEIVPPAEGAVGEQPTDSDRREMRNRLFGEKNPIMKSFETTAGRGLAGVITSLNFDWGLNGEINWDIESGPGYKAPQGCKVSISFTPIHDITPGLDSDGMMRAPVFNVAGASPHGNEDPHPRGYARRVATNDAQTPQANQTGGGGSA